MDISAEQVSHLLNHGTASHRIPVEHLDYSFIEKCKDVKYLEKLLKILRSGEEGCYPHLQDFCERRIENLAPKSRALRKEKSPATATDFTAEEWQTIDGDFKKWVREMQEKENKFRVNESSASVDRSCPPVRGSDSSVLTRETQDCAAVNRTNKRSVAPREYRDWDKFNVEEECAKIEDSRTEKSSKTSFSMGPTIEKIIDTAGKTDEEKIFLSNYEKQKGNEAFYAADYEEAVTYYSRSISVLPTAAAFNNRALAKIKLQLWLSALTDCEKVLELEPGNLKALLRRATVHKNMKNYNLTMDDLKKVLLHEPDNSMAKKLMLEVEKGMQELELKARTQTKGKTIHIEDVEGSDEEKGKERHFQDSSLAVGGEIVNNTSEMGNTLKKSTDKGGSPYFGNERHSPKPTNEASSPRKRGSYDKNSASEEVKKDEIKKNDGHKSEEKPDKQDWNTQEKANSSSSAVQNSGNLPPPAAKLKSQGNELFKNGQFGDAIDKYTEAIKTLTDSGTENLSDMSILYSNRAACYLKTGNCSECIEDCTRALELQPFSLKPLLRRAIAYETTERYRQGYVDFKTALQIDSGIQSASDGVNRITKALLEQDGVNWREKLPPIPQVPATSQLHRPTANETTSLQNSTNNDLGSNTMPQNTEETSDELFLKFKQEGNNCVKSGNYEEGIKSYCECLKLKRDECAIYTNRALCYLKLNKYEESKNDCDLALQLEPSNIKALYRRAMANKGLKNFETSVNDLNKIIILDQNIAEVNKELQELTEILAKQTHEQNCEKHRKPVHIYEVSESEDEEKEGEPVARESCGSSERLHLMPTNAYEFGQAINAVKSKWNIGSCAELLANIEPRDLPRLMSNKLDGDTFLIIIQALGEHIQKNPNLVYQHLLYLQKVERFKVALTLLSTADKKKVQQLFSHLAERQNEYFTSEDVKNVENEYEV
ncbi:sperm-associated antigen 1 [Protopterus annectens]|uniref:sperm-associated antigen 1 n=1 Tax=Protopterus annectens TaxID=7888 RepID=UPI001CF989E7|nr:sperm-associated antigen 1 [Protopterus annectens]